MTSLVDHLAHMTEARNNCLARLTEVEAERDALAGLVGRIQSASARGAIAARATGNYSGERAWLDVAALLERGSN